MRKIKGVYFGGWGGKRVSEHAWLAAGYLPPGGLWVHLPVSVHPQHLLVAAP